jgi:hypothetical protein
VSVTVRRADDPANERDLTRASLELARLNRRRAAGEHDVEQEDREHGGYRERDHQADRTRAGHASSLAPDLGT